MLDFDHDVDDPESYHSCSISDMSFKTVFSLTLNIYTLFNIFTSVSDLK